MNDDDIQKLRGVIREEVTSVVKAEIDSSEQRITGNFREELEATGKSFREELEATGKSFREELEATSKNLRKDLTEVIRTEISASEHKLEAKITQLGNDIGDWVAQQILPQIAEKADKSDIERLEMKIDRIVDKDTEQDNRLGLIESVSVVALELKKPSKKH